ncbi:MAG: Cytochrome c oxidase subunit 2 precursor [Pseudomonadota bacterium]
MTCVKCFEIRKRNKIKFDKAQTRPPTRLKFLALRCNTEHSLFITVVVSFETWKFVKTMKSISKTLSSLLSKAGIWAGAWAATAAYAVNDLPGGPAAAYAVNDLPGGPAVNQLDFHPAASKIAEEQHSLHVFMMILCTVIFVAVFAVMFYSIWKHRKSVGHKPATFHESMTVEIIWTIVPFIIVILMALPATKVLVASKDTTNADLTVKATGYQWKWGYDYIKGEGEGIGFISTLDNAHREMSNAKFASSQLPTT